MILIPLINIMSAISGTLMWVAKRDSKIKFDDLSVDELRSHKGEVCRSISIIATIRQRFLDGYYTREDKEYSDTIYYKDGTVETQVNGEIVAISLGDESVVLRDEGAVKNKENFEKYYDGVIGKIHLILETPEALIPINISTISEIESYFGPKEIFIQEELRDPASMKNATEIYKGVLAKAMIEQGTEMV